MDFWNGFSCCNINCLAKMYYRFMLNHWGVSPDPKEKKEANKSDGSKICWPKGRISKDWQGKGYQIIKMLPKWTSFSCCLYPFCSPLRSVDQKNNSECIFVLIIISLNLYTLKHNCITSNAIPVFCSNVHGNVGKNDKGGSCHPKAICLTLKGNLIITTVLYSPIKEVG